MGSGSPSLPHAITSLASYTRMTRSDVLMRNELKIKSKFIRSLLKYPRANSYSPRLANSILLTAVTLDVPIVILKLA